MGVRFESPVWLLLLLPAVALAVIPHLASRRRLGLRRQRTALAIRLALLASLVFALAGFQLVLPVDRLATVFVVDLSDSVGQAGHDDAVAFLRQTLAAMPKDDQAGIVAFGKDALVERLPEEVRDLDRLHSAPVTAATDIGAALRLASALFPDATQKRIVVVSDGNDTTGRGQLEAALAAARGIQIDTRAVGLANADEVLIDRLTTPSTANLHDAIPATATVSSTVAQPATVRLYLDGNQIREERVDLAAGSNTVEFGDGKDGAGNATSDDPPIIPADPGFHTFRAVVEAGRDTFSQNNRADSNTIIKGPPRILLVAGDSTVGAQLEAALKTEGQLVDTVIPEALPTDLTSLVAYDSVILVDVPRLRLSDQQLTALQVSVRDIGHGLVMIGGPESYGAGGYTKTPIEETLPVDMGVRDRQKEPDIALVVVIDKSGSMDACHCNSFGNGNPTGGTGIGGVRKVDIGKEAILRAAAALTNNDELGVVAFDESAHWVVNTEPLGQVGDLSGLLAGIQPNGTTNIHSGLDQAVQSLEQTTATRRHIILLTDGWSRSGQYDQILARMKADGITLSTVGAGGGANPFLAQLAQEGGGRFYAAPNESDIPDIFLKETQQVAGEQIVEEPFYPVQTSASPILRGIDTGFPQLLGYNGTTAKSAAQTVLVTARDDPLLAQWQYGLGRSVAWTSDSTAKWARNWLSWPGFDRFFSQLVGWTFPGEETGGIEATFESTGSDTTLHVQSEEPDGSPRDFYSTTAVVVGPDLEPHQVTLDQSAPGVYETDLGEIDAGAYAVRITQTKPGATALGRTVGLVEPVAPEYRLLGINQPLLASLRSATGGIEVAAPTDPWIHNLRATSSFTELWPWLLVLALLLWPLDVGLRRVSIGRRELRDARAWAGRRWRARRGPVARTASAAGMLAARERAAGSAARAALFQAEASTATRPPFADPDPVLPKEVPASIGDLPSAAPPPPSDADPTETLARLREAKRRARGG